MKKLLTALKYFFLALGLLFLEQLPTAFIAADQPFWQSALIILALLIVVCKSSLLLQFLLLSEWGC